MERVTEIYVILENKPSVLGDLCSHLAETGINIDSIGVFHDTAKLVVSNLNKALKVLDEAQLHHRAEGRPADRPREQARRPGRADHEARRRGHQHRILLRDAEPARATRSRSSWTSPTSTGRSRSSGAEPGSGPFLRNPPLPPFFKGGTISPCNEAGPLSQLQRGTYFPAMARSTDQRPPPLMTSAKADGDGQEMIFEAFALSGPRTSS